MPKKDTDDLKIQKLEMIIENYAPEPGINPMYESEPEKGSLSYVGVTTFSKLPISKLTLKALNEAEYKDMTLIQKAALPHALAGRDILGAAKTGSGKTLAFLIPVIEKLYRLDWSDMASLGALILTPTRELALQIFDELRKIGKYHDFRAGVLVGGNNAKKEKLYVNKIQILIATPGRLLYHMHETPLFEPYNIQILVLDEADKLLDLGFSDELNSILECIKNERQTLLFSATQTKRVQDLARLSLVDPEYLTTDKDTILTTPLKLKQFYITCEVQDKIMILWSFLKSHTKLKILVFFSTCSQVRFIYESFKKLMKHREFGCLHGHLRQGARLKIYNIFCKSKKMVLFTTDIASRGLDIPKIDWVIQMDCPEDIKVYIHRVGRTARYKSDGKALLILDENEIEMKNRLMEKNIPIKNIKLNNSKLESPVNSLKHILKKTPELKICAQKALLRYLKSIALQPDKSVFKLGLMDLNKLGESFGLDTIPLTKPFKKIIKKIDEEKSKLSKKDDQKSNSKSKRKLNEIYE